METSAPESTKAVMSKGLPDRLLRVTLTIGLATIPNACDLCLENGKQTRPKAPLPPSLAPGLSKFSRPDASCGPSRRLFRHRSHVPRWICQRLQHTPPRTGPSIFAATAERTGKGLSSLLSQLNSRPRYQPVGDYFNGAGGEDLTGKR